MSKSYKLISWNVNGLRAVEGKDPSFTQIFNDLDADMFCLQETKLQEGQIDLDLPGYYETWSYADKKGYSGTAVFSKEKPIQVKHHLDVEEADDEGRICAVEFENFWLVDVYTPNAQDGLKRIGARLDWDERFRTFLKELEETKPVISCGDFNVAHNEIDLKNPKPNIGKAGFSDEERESFTKLLDAGFTDSFRYLHPDETDAYSWWTYRFKARERNAGWRIDYFLVSNDIASHIQKASILSDIYGSDHCPIELDIEF